MVDITSLAQTKQLAEQFANKLEKGDVLALSGELGSGKTTFTQFLLAALGIEDKVKSPTFILQREYFASKLNCPAIHIDLYRAESSAIASDLELNDDTLQNQLTIIEWPEIVQDLLPEHTQWIRFELTDDKRTVEVS